MERVERQEVMLKEYNEKVVEAELCRLNAKYKNKFY